MGFNPKDPGLKKMAEAGALIDQRTGRPLGEPVPARMSVLSGVLKRVCVVVPPSTNHLFLTAGRRRVKTSEYRDWLAVAVPEIAKLQRPAKFPVRIIATLFGKPPAINMQRDIANIEKACGDALVEAGIIPDDCLKYVVETTQRFVLSDDGPGVWLEVLPA